MSLRPKKRTGTGGKRKPKTERRKSYEEMSPWERHKERFKYNPDNKPIRFKDTTKTTITTGIAGKQNTQIENYWLKKSESIYEILSKKHKVQYIDIQYSGVTATFDIMIDDTKGKSIDIYKILKKIAGDSINYLQYQHRFFVTPYSDGTNIYLDASPDNYDILYKMYKKEK